MTPRTLLSLGASAALIATLFLADGCARRARRDRRGATTNELASVLGDDAPVIILDGETKEWPENIVAAADEHDLYLRFSIQETPTTLQASPRTTAILLDTDADASTGRRPTGAMGLDSLGVDLEVRLSPKREDGRPGRGCAMFLISADGSQQKVDPYDWDFSFSPTYASEWYEARLSRTPSGPAPAAPGGLLAQGTVRGAVVVYDDAGNIDMACEPFETATPAPCRPDVRKSIVGIPPKRAGAIRVVSWNVLRTSPAQKPDVFARVLRALQPDVVLVQEWEVDSSEQLARWFATNLSDMGSWDAVAEAGTVQTGAGVGVVSLFPTEPLREGPVTLSAESGGAPGKRVRAALARVSTPWGDAAFASVHLKSGGSAGSDEDVLRIHEANAINAALSGAGLPRIVAGDYNLVGSRTPLETLVRGQDGDGSDLGVAQPETLGDRTYITWAEKGNVFTPGRLDWLVFSDANLRARRAFVLDTSRLREETLAKFGLTPGDCAGASDHMPVVVDLERVE
jgi:endonuclease/exonuclease/phosphatase family metal-dependent hydrolase